jgi:hypothetical protein
VMRGACAHGRLGCSGQRASGREKNAGGKGGGGASERAQGFQLQLVSFNTTRGCGVRSPGDATQSPFPSRKRSPPLPSGLKCNTVALGRQILAL